VIRDLSDAANAGGLFGRSAFCTWAGRCPSGRELSLVLRTPEVAGSLPTLSVVDLLGRTGLPDATEATRRTVLIGVTDPWHARVVRVGGNAVSMSWAEAVGHAIATSRAYAPIPNPGPLGETLLILLALALSMALTRLERIAGSGLITVLFPSLLVAGLGVEGILLRVLVPPLTAMVLVASVTPLMAALASRRVARDFLRSVALALVQDALRYAWRDTRIRTPEDLAAKLITLTGARFPACRTAYLHRAGRSALRWVDGSGMEERDLAEALTIHAPAFRQAQLHPSGTRAERLLVQPLVSRVLAIREGRVVVGFWCVVVDPDVAEPDPGALAEVAEWVSQHLELEQPGHRRTAWEWLRDRMESDTDTVRKLFSTASEERRRQLQALNAIDLPFLTADPSGSVLFVNTAMAELLADHGLATTNSLPDLISGLDRAQDQRIPLHRLFAAGESFAVQWGDDHHAWRAVAQAVSRGGDGGEELLGYVVHIEDRTHTERLEDIRASVVDFASTRVRNALMVIVGYAGLLRAKAADAASTKMLDIVKRNAEEVAAAMDELKALVGLDAEPDRLLEVDFARLLREVVHEVKPVAEARSVELALAAPEVSLPVLASPTRAQHALAVLLHDACVTSTPGSVVKILLEEREEDTLFRIQWSGAGFDPAVLAAATEDWHRDLSGLPRELYPYARARAAFKDLTLTSAPGEGVEVQFTLRRSGRA
jgi:signal transduction histidine kinase